MLVENPEEHQNAPRPRSVGLVVCCAASIIIVNAFMLKFYGFGGFANSAVCQLIVAIWARWGRGC